ncbi:hypothetical protein MHO82_18395 [Vibrio sp. Of7-15]|uniref:hypothetical protein n=1 Tax=Vibrio sp. Of7-15 TaxID=2724879 RepID=UPI001EF17A3B|nr:hypothetical protein [Vibrio sp. Of7-15]MCG7498843.1 hypothetical protein [Vibrio sp. Of7-15]
MSWNYRVLENEGELAIYEVYYDDSGAVKGHSLTPTYPRAESFDGLKEELELYAEALIKPILKYQE